MQAELEPLDWRYDVVVANPPYMGSKNMNKWLGDWIKTHYKDMKGDLFSCFMVRNVGMGAEHAQLGFMTPYVWMFIGTYEKLRKFVIQQNTITSLIQLEYSGFSGATVPICTFTVQKGYCPGYHGGYVRLSDFVGADQQAPRALEALANPDCGWFYRADASSFEAIPGSPVAYWVQPNILRAFSLLAPMSNTALPKQGLATGDNNLFIHQWWEVSMSTIGMSCSNRDEAKSRGTKWFPCNKGGGFRKWFGNNELVVNWENDGAEIRSFLKNGKLASRPQNMDWYFKEGITWGTISSADLSMRYSPKGFMFETKGSMCFAKSHDDLIYCLAFTNSSLVKNFMKVLSPTLDYHEGPLGRLPLKIDNKENVTNLAKKAINAAEMDWDSFEVSWDFRRHPLI